MSTPASPAGWLTLLKLENGRESHILTTGTDGMHIGPGVSVQLEMPVHQGDRVLYELLAEDGLDVGFEVAVQSKYSGETNELMPRERRFEFDGELSVDEDGTCILCIDNEHSWISSKRFHANFERLAMGRTSGQNARVSSCKSHVEEEAELKRAHVASLRAEESQLSRRADKLRRQLSGVEADLERVREVLGRAVEEEERRCAAMAHVGVEAAAAGATGADAPAGESSAAAGTGEVGADGGDVSGDASETSGGVQGSSVDAGEDDEEGVVRSRLWSLWRRLSHIDPHVVIEARWAEPSEITLTGADEGGGEGGGEGSACLLVHRLSMRQQTLHDVARITRRSDVDEILLECMQRIAAEPQQPGPPASSVEEQSAAAPTLGASAPEPASEERNGAGEGTSTSHGSHQDGRTALEQLQLLSSLLLQIDPQATMDVAPVGEAGHEYELVSITLLDNKLTSLGTVTSATNVSQIAEVCRRATGGDSGSAAPS